MKKTDSIWRFVLKIVGMSLAAAGMICLVVAFWDKLLEGATGVKEKLSRYSEFDDYDDDLLCE